MKLQRKFVTAPATLFFPDCLIVRVITVIIYSLYFFFLCMHPLAIGVSVTKFYVFYVHVHVGQGCDATSFKKQHIRQG